MNEPAPHQDYDEEILASRLTEARTVLGLTQQDVASRLGRPRTAISDIENGHRKVSGVELIRMARLYHRSLSWLTGDTTPPNPDDPLAAVAGLSERDRNTVIAFARFLAHQAATR